MSASSWFTRTIYSRRAQILLPAVMLAPIFILIIYLLFETSKLSMTKVRQQFALDNGAYSQMSTTSGYLNSLAMINGNLPYRVMKTYDTPLPRQQNSTSTEKRTVFDLFYAAGAFPAAGRSHSLGPSGAIKNPVPTAEATDWNFQYYGDRRKSWQKEDPTHQYDMPEEQRYVMTDKTITDNYIFGADKIGLNMIREYATLFVRTGSIYINQTYVYKNTVNKSHMFRVSYFYNTKDCSRHTCGKQAADVLDKFELQSKPFEINNVRFNVTADYDGMYIGSSVGSFPVDITFSDIIKRKLFQFAYLTPESRSRLKQLGHGVVLKQKFVVPENRFNINLTQRYKPYVRNTVSVTCPRSNNNCVWPNPLPKYSVKVGV